jgi:hypothetical protein
MSGNGPMSIWMSTLVLASCVAAATISRKARFGIFFRPTNDNHGKLLLMAPGYDRSGALGFRCVKDAE